MVAMARRCVRLRRLGPDLFLLLSRVDGSAFLFFFSFPVLIDFFFSFPSFLSLSVSHVCQMFLHFVFAFRDMGHVTWRMRTVGNMIFAGAHHKQRAGVHFYNQIDNDYSFKRQPCRLPVLGPSQHANAGPGGASQSCPAQCTHAARRGKEKPEHAIRPTD
jgi:hypothetical protein